MPDISDSSKIKTCFCYRARYYVQYDVRRAVHYNYCCDKALLFGWQKLATWTGPTRPDLARLSNPGHPTLAADLKNKAPNMARRTPSPWAPQCWCFTIGPPPEVPKCCFCFQQSGRAKGRSCAIFHYQRASPPGAHMCFDRK